MSASKIAYRYAKSLIELAQDQNLLEEVRKDMSTFQDGLESRDFVNLLNSPIVKADKKVKIFDAIFGGHINDLTQRYFHLIVQKGRESDLPNIANAFVEQYNALKKVTRVQVTVAKAMDDDQLKAIEEKLSASDKTQENVQLDVQIDPEIMGGFILEFEGQKYDESVRSKLTELRKNFSNN